MTTTATPHRQRNGQYRSILHVHVTDDLTGSLLADIDAPSVADGLAYYLRSRHLDEAATEASVLANLDGQPGIYAPVDRQTGIVIEQRGIGTGNLELALYAHVEGQCPSTADCAR